MKRSILAAVLVGTLAWATAASAQPLPQPASGLGTGAPLEAEVAAGAAFFLDDAPQRYGLAGAAARFWLTPRLAVGPEYTYGVGPGDARDQTLTANLTYAFRDSGLTPFVVVGGGLFRHSDRFNGQTFSSSEGAFTAGGGVRFPFSGGWYVAPEARIGWEPHTRVHVAIGKRF
jgi:opacity protein-like surface antigen